MALKASHKSARTSRNSQQRLRLSVKRRTRHMIGSGVDKSVEITSRKPQAIFECVELN